MAAWKPAAPCASQRLSPAGLSNLQTLPKVASLTAVTVPGLSQFRFPKTLVPLDALPSQMTPACAIPAKSSAAMIVALSFNVMTDFTDIPPLDRGILPTRFVFCFNWQAGLYPSQGSLEKWARCLKTLPDIRLQDIEVHYFL